MVNKQNLKPRPFTTENQPKNRKSRKGVPNRSTVLKKWLTTKKDVKNPITGETKSGTLEDEIVLALILQARQGSVTAFREIMDSIYGKPTQTVDVGNKDDKPFKNETRVILPTTPDE